MYHIILTDAEVETLAWAADRGYFPIETYDAMHLADGEPEDVASNVERKWLIPEHAAWAITQLREEDEHACFTCIGDPLLSKLLDLENSIV